MTTTPFLGCKISLISKSEIRYEGILYTIDPKESTIALAKVRSYGTEDRPAERQVQPRDEIFEYIIFRAADIKDLIVDDPPASIAPGLADPAIIQAHSTSTSSSATFPSSTFPQMTTTSSISATAGQRSSVAAFQALNVAPTHVSGVPVSYTTNSESPSRTSTPTGPQRKSPTNEIANQTNTGKTTPNKEMKTTREQRGNQFHRSDNRNDYRGHQRGDHRGDYRGENRTDHRGDYRADHRGDQRGDQRSEQRAEQRGEQRGDHRADQRGDRRTGQQNFDKSGQNFRQQRGGQNYRPQNRNYSQPDTMGTRFSGNRQYNSYYNNNNAGFNSGQRRGSSQPTRRPQQQRISQSRPSFRAKETIKFEGDFDFDKAEKEFQELEEKMSNLKVESNAADKHEKDGSETESSNLNELVVNNDGLPEKDIDNENQAFYDKGKSFFDTISCEALERSKGNYQRIDWKAERKLNSETFGVPMSFRRQLYRGGYGGRGQYRNASRGGFGSFNR